MRSDDDDLHPDLREIHNALDRELGFDLELPCEERVTAQPPATSSLRARDRRQRWRWNQVARFDDEGVDLEYDPASKQIVVRTLRDDGTIASVAVPSGLVEPWRALASTRDGAFGSKSRGPFVVAEGSMLPCPVGGNGCERPPTAERTTFLRSPTR